MNCFRVLGDDGEKDTRGSVWVGSALFPVSHRGRRKTEAGCELGLTQIEPAPYLPNVHLRDVNTCDANRNLFALRPTDRLVEAGDDLLTWCPLSVDSLSACNPSFH